MGPVGLLYWTFRFSKAVGGRLSRTILGGRWLNLKTKFLSLDKSPTVFWQNHVRALLKVASLAALTALVPVSVSAAPSERDFLWAGDPEGGAPFVEADPAQPDKVVGFDVEIADLIARGLGRKAGFINVTFTSIDQSIERGDAEIGLSGIEDTPARRDTMAPTVPYYQFREVLSVRDADASRFRTLADLRGRRVGTLGGTIAYEILLRAERDFGIQAVSYDDDVHPYSDLVIGRLDAVLLDNVLAERRRRALPGFTIQPQSVAVGHYVGVLAARNAPLRDAIDEILRGAMRDGSLETHFPQMGRVERRSAGALRPRSGRRACASGRRSRCDLPAGRRSPAGKRRDAIYRRWCAHR